MSDRRSARGRRGAVARIVAGAAFVAVAGVVAVARADTPPSVWDRAKEPGLGDARASQIEVARFFVGIGSAPRDRRKELLERLGPRMLRRLELGAEASTYLPLRLGLAQLENSLGELDPSHWRKGAEHARYVLAHTAEPSIVLDASNVLASACGHLGDSACEREAYLTTLRWSQDDLDRVVPTLNLAESEMRLGNLKSAVEGYRECVRLVTQVSPSSEVVLTLVLATWGLSVALDRSGDRAGAEREAILALDREAQGTSKSALLRDTTRVFFVPTYEVLYYEGVGFAARARAASTGRASEKLWAQAERAFATFVEAAERDRDRWLEHGKARLREAKSEHEKAKRRAAKEPPEREDGREVTF